MLEAATACEVDSFRLGQIERQLISLSDAISVRYFLQFEQPDDVKNDSLLA